MAAGIKITQKGKKIFIQLRFNWGKKIVWGAEIFYVQIHILSVICQDENSLKIVKIYFSVQNSQGTKLLKFISKQKKVLWSSLG